MASKNTKLAEILKQRRLKLSITLVELAQQADMSPSYLWRIERGERFPSAHALRKLAGPLQFKEVELLGMAEYFSSPSPVTTEDNEIYRRIDPYVAAVLAQEPVEVQRMVVYMLILMKGLLRNLAKDKRLIDKVLATCIVNRRWEARNGFTESERRVNSGKLPRTMGKGRDIYDHLFM